MPRRPGGGEPPPQSVEAGLRRLAWESGPTVTRLVESRAEGIGALMQAAQPPADWPVEVKAYAVLSVIREVVQDLANPRWRAAAQAALRIPADDYQGPDHDSVAARWRELVRREGIAEAERRARVDAYRGYWMTAAQHLAEAIESRFRELNRIPDSWAFYRPDAPYAPPLSLPISFDRTEVIYRFHGDRGVQSISLRWLTALGEVDHYEAIGWYYNEPDAPVEIVPLANCELDGPLRDLPQGGRCGTLRFGHTLQQDERYFFAYTTLFNSDRPCRPAIMYENRVGMMQTLTIRAQFDPAVLPVRCWWFDVATQVEVSRTPEDGAPEFLTVPPNGYVEHEFTQCEWPRKCGLRWEWPSGPHAAGSPSTREGPIKMGDG